MLAAATGWAVASGWLPPIGPLSAIQPNLGPLLPEESESSARSAPGARVAPNRDSATGTVVVPDPKIPDSFTLGGLPPTRSPLVFTDLDDQHWAKPYIDALTARGVLNGLPDGTFAPDRPLNRAELATQIANAFAMPAQNSGKAFGDLAVDYWATEPINQAVMMGFMTGYPESEFRPDEVVSRLQVLVALATGLSLPETTVSQQQLQQYADWQEIPSWARRQVGAVMQAGIISPSPDEENRLRPQASATRAEVAALIYASLVYLGQVGALPE